ncbi:MAG: hypothetical protein OXT67_00770 [Zetaproteobacteria bacterium]|nr:hypothetical protein [Zetaproteobacteria bacterium]
MHQQQLDAFLKSPEQVIDLATARAACALGILEAWQERHNLESAREKEIRERHWQQLPFPYQSAEIHQRMHANNYLTGYMSDVANQYAEEILGERATYRGAPLLMFHERWHHTSRTFEVGDILTLYPVWPLDSLRGNVGPTGRLQVFYLGNWQGEDYFVADFLDQPSTRAQLQQYMAGLCRRSTCSNGHGGRISYTGQAFDQEAFMLEGFSRVFIDYDREEDDDGAFWNDNNSTPPLEDFGGLEIAAGTPAQMVDLAREITSTYPRHLFIGIGASPTSLLAIAEEQGAQVVEIPLSGLFGQDNGAMEWHQQPQQQATLLHWIDAYLHDKIPQQPGAIDGIVLVDFAVGGQSVLVATDLLKEWLESYSSVPHTLHTLILAGWKSSSFVHQYLGRQSYRVLSLAEDYPGVYSMMEYGWKGRNFSGSHKIRRYPKAVPHLVNGSRPVTELDSYRSFRAKLRLQLQQDHWAP